MNAPSQRIINISIELLFIKTFWNLFKTHNDVIDKTKYIVYAYQNGKFYKQF